MSGDARLDLPPGRIGASTTNYRKNEERERKKASLVEMNSRRGTRSSKHDSKTSMTRYVKPEFGDNGESPIYPPICFFFLTSAPHSFEIHECVPLLRIYVKRFEEYFSEKDTL